MHVQGASPMVAVSYETELFNVKRVYQDLGISSCKFTHDNRRKGAQDAVNLGATETGVRQQGGWSTDSLVNAYLTSLPKDVMRALAGHEANKFGSVQITRDRKEPEIPQMILRQLVGKYTRYSRETSQATAVWRTCGRRRYTGTCVIV